MKNLFRAPLMVLSLALAMIATPAQAAVRYDFTAFSAFSFGTPAEAVTGSFSLILPDFFSGDVTFPVAALTSCSASGSITGPAACGEQRLFTTAIIVDALVFRTFLPSGTVDNSFFFQPGAFSAVGTYDNTFSAPPQIARLTVSLVGGAVPEPATWAMMITGFGIVGGATRRRNSVRVTKVTYG